MLYKILNGDGIDIKLKLNTWVPNTSDARMYVRISTEYHVNIDSIRTPHLSLYRACNYCTLAIDGLHN